MGAVRPPARRRGVGAALAPRDARARARRAIRGEIERMLSPSAGTLRAIDLACNGVPDVIGAALASAEVTLLPSGSAARAGELPGCH